MTPLGKLTAPQTPCWIWGGKEKREEGKEKSPVRFGETVSNQYNQEIPRYHVMVFLVISCHGTSLPTTSQQTLLVNFTGIFLHHIAAWSSSNSPIKNHEDRPRDHPNGGVKCKGVGKSCNFRPISRYSS